ncbi:hypothetical protein GFB56_26620 [Ensifer sp. T173]|uniref:Uncharacterized protein n=1 Tax=Ensifer canadensis TaxID=555315 RepID=A0AAW4FT12_9HYPH|nr:hypothetical protein [Ensifer canadensis]
MRADQVGYGTAAALLPIFELIEAHVFAAKRLFGDDTTTPTQACRPVGSTCPSPPASRRQGCAWGQAIELISG